MTNIKLDEPMSHLIVFIISGQLIVQDLRQKSNYFESYESPKDYDDTYMGKE